MIHAACWDSIDVATCWRTPIIIDVVRLEWLHCSVIHKTDFLHLTKLRILQLSTVFTCAFKACVIRILTITARVLSLTHTHNVWTHGHPVVSKLCNAYAPLVVWAGGRNPKVVTREHVQVLWLCYGRKLCIVNVYRECHASNSEICFITWRTCLHALVHHQLVSHCHFDSDVPEYIR